MRPTPTTLKLPAKLVDELGGFDALARNIKPQHSSTSRRDKRKADRVHKKAERNGRSALKRQKLWHPQPTDVKSHKLKAQDGHQNELPQEESIIEGELKTNSIPSVVLLPNELAGDDPYSHQSSQLPVNIPRHLAARLAQDDAEIAALEKKLGIKSKKQLPRAFRDDGLDELMGGIDGELGTTSQVDDANQAGRIWLAEKRSQANPHRFGANGNRRDGGLRSRDEDTISDTHSARDTFSGHEEDDCAGMSVGSTGIDIESDFLDSGSKSESAFAPSPLKRVKENPYVAPAPHGIQTHLKYIPPSLREPSFDNELLVRLRRQVQGLVNRLTEANLISILSGVEKLYRENARKHVTSTLVNLLLVSVCEPTTLSDTLIILIAGFITAIYKVIGTDFGAHVIERLVNSFDEHYDRASKTDDSAHAASPMSNSKETSNLITLLAELYNFQLVGSILIFDYIRFFLRNLSELNAELLLRIIRISGPQLRQDDPSSLRDIVAMLRPAMDTVGEQSLSVRTKFMIDSINDLKNNRLRTGLAASSVNSEHIIQMKKILGTLNTQNIKTSEPLRLGLRDIYESDKKGKWWLVGASWIGNALTDEPGQTEKSILRRIDEKVDVIGEIGDSDLVRLAREQRMNTDIRKAIFVTIMSASDYQDAYSRLMKLKLKRVQELEIPKVLIHCSSAEKGYNPYYTLIAQKLCSNRKLRMAFQFSLWDIFKRLGETNLGGEGLEENDDEEILDTRLIVNYAKMYGTLIVEGGLSLVVLKHLNLRYLQAKTMIFVEVLLVTVLLRTQAQPKSGRDEQALRSVFSKAKDLPSTIRGLQYFLRKFVIKTDIAGGKTATATVKWACEVAVRTLQNLPIAGSTNS